MESETLPLLKYLKERGIALKDLIDTALELFVPHPGVETKEKPETTDGLSCTIHGVGI